MKNANVSTPEPQREPNHRATNSGAQPMSLSRTRRSIAWSELDRASIGRLVASVCDAGNGIVLGRTSDGGALAITILDGISRYREYPTSYDDFEQLVTWAASVYSSD